MRVHECTYIWMYCYVYCDCMGISVPRKENLSFLNIP